MEIDLDWPKDADEGLRREVHEVLHAVVAAGGAIGWQSPPDRAGTDAWLDDVLTRVRAGDAALAVARVDGVVRATASWRRDPAKVFENCAELGKVTAHPAARGLGLGRTVVAAIVENARSAGLEVLYLGVRGNNLGAIELYEELGFREWGRLPNSIAVGDQRFDSVRMHLPLGHAPHVELRGSTPGGNGSSSRRRAP
ncbi:GNAT family N-acetyltransferase [Umezawaea sp.]|uniref:GNAT family N-acetyltransferase n=1 Tax=Umezawaea sp. TaxID=1955258 RepID=UPI002ED29B94